MNFGITSKEIKQRGSLILLGLFGLLMLNPIKEYIMEVFEGNYFWIGLIGFIVVLYFFKMD